MARILRLAVAGSVVALGLTLLSGPARADTACADVWIENSPGTPTPVLGPGNCEPTPFGRVLNTWGGVCVPGLPPGPCGVSFDIWLTGPV